MGRRKTSIFWAMLPGEAEAWRDQMINIIESEVSSIQNVIHRIVVNGVHLHSKVQSINLIHSIDLQTEKTLPDVIPGTL